MIGSKADIANNSFESDGTLVFQGDGTVWDDLRVPLETGRTAGANVPAFEQVITDGAASNGVYAYNFDDDDEIWFSIQMPHGWELASTVYPHVHWLPETAASGSSVGFGLEYTWTSIYGTTGNTSTGTCDAACSGTALYHHISNLPTAGVAGTGKGLSSMLLCRLYRRAAAGSNYGGGVFITEFDVHFELDMVGSRQVTTK